jgi:flagellar assembly protein FliH
VPDLSLARGDAIAEYPDGELDARIGSALARARAALAGETP